MLQIGLCLDCKKEKSLSHEGGASLPSTFREGRGLYNSLHMFMCSYVPGYGMSHMIPDTSQVSRSYWCFEFQRSVSKMTCHCLGFPQTALSPCLEIQHGVPTTPWNQDYPHPTHLPSCICSGASVWVEGRGQEGRATGGIPQKLQSKSSNILPALGYRIHNEWRTVWQPHTESLYSLPLTLIAMQCETDSHYSSQSTCWSQSRRAQCCVI